MPNHLINETSPYLLAHAKNPVNWYPWGEDALRLARQENKPIFLSIGYSSCHWCHVMEKESFENEMIAKILNENFISIKIDREERPDIDKYFQEVYLLMNGRSGGWPTSIFLTPDLKPFYSATYIPSTPKYGMMGFDELLNVITKRYKQDESLLKEKGNEILEFLNPKKRKIEATRLELGIESKFTAQTKSIYDKNFGGFGDSPKFPQASTYMTLIDFYKFNNDDELFRLIKHSLNCMVRGGFYDLVDGGFCRYSTDKKWLVPHFEKMTYDNALLCELYLKAYLLTSDEKYKSIAFDTAKFMLDRMSDGELFYSASDADSKGKEGEYFVYDYDEALQAFKNAGINDPAMTAKQLSITKNGNFEGKSIINCKEENIPQYDIAINALKDLRLKREYPFIDKKIILAWNAMMINSLFLLSQIDESYTDKAKDSLAYLIKKLYKNNTLYHSTINDNEPKIEAFLEDYAYLTNTLIGAYNVTHKKSYLDFATILANEAIKKFYKNYEWEFANGDFATKAEIYDSSYPSSLAIMLDALLKLDILTNFDYEEIIFKSIERHSYSLMRQPISSPLMCSAASKYLRKYVILKSSKVNMENFKNEILKLNYPYLLTEINDDDNWSICGKGACFAHASSFNEIKIELDKLSITNS
ncbi:MAG: hypothetical protein KN64_08900 [Sulfurovum sp. AS07-7]|nr:MAG: hypothetical protein KN64_08900 [Sulfurovum sp. AS07-7]